MKKPTTLGILLGIGSSIIAGTNCLQPQKLSKYDSIQQKRSFEETRLCYDPSETSDRAMGIWATDYNGISLVTLTDHENNILLADDLHWSYMKNPHGILIRIGRILDDGTYHVGVYDKKGNHFSKQFTIRNKTIREP